MPQAIPYLGPSWPEVLMYRELTRDERKGIRKLVTEMCANYDREYSRCCIGIFQRATPAALTGREKSI